MLVGNERNDTLRYLKGINPSISFLTLQVGEKTIVGFKKKEIHAAFDAFETHMVGIITSSSSESP